MRLTRVLMIVVFLAGCAAALPARAGGPFVVDTTNYTGVAQRWGRAATTSESRGAAGPARLAARPSAAYIASSHPPNSPKNRCPLISHPKIASVPSMRRRRAVSVACTDM